MAKKKRRGRSATLYKVNKKKLVFAVILVIAVCVASATVSRVLTGYDYSGLGAPKSQNLHKYNPNSFYFENGLKKYSGMGYKSKNGIDVSEHQGEINWRKVKDFGIEFVMIRVGYRGSSNGKIYLDKRFKENIKGAKAVGLEIGVYFYSQAVSTDEAVEEAEFVLKQIKGKGVTLPVAYDMEMSSSSDRVASLSNLERTAAADAFCSCIADSGKAPIIYGNPSWLLNKIDLNYLTDYPIWLAHYVQISTYPYDYTMWQYSDKGNVPGISTRTDMNILLYK